MLPFNRDMARLRLPAFFLRLMDPLLRGRREARLTAEIQTHLEALADEFRKRGMSQPDARLAAERAFGGVDRVRLLHRDQRSLPALDWLLFDLQAGVRVVARERLFSLGIVLVLALGLMVNTTIFTIVNGMTWRGLPVPNADQIVLIESQILRPRQTGTYTSFADFRDWRAATQTLADMAAYRTATMNVADEAHPADRLSGVFLTTNAFALLGVQPVIGRDFSAADDSPDAGPVVILGHHLWRARYATDPAIVGRTIRLNGTQTTVIGVMPEGFKFPLFADAWRPVTQMPAFDPVTRVTREFNVIGRLRDGVSIEQARAEMEAVSAAVSAQHPGTNADLSSRTVPFTFAFVPPPPEAREPLIMLIAAAIVLLIACANGANLLLARAGQRAREMALRATLGASRFGIVRQLLVEALLLSAVAAGLGLALSKVAVGVFARETADMGLPFWIAFDFDARVFVYVATACLGTAVLFGLLPAWQASRTNTSDVLKDGGRGAIGGRRAQRWAGALLVCELALTLTLLGGAGILIRSSAALGATDRLLDLDRILAAQVGLPANRYDPPEARRALHARLQSRFDQALGIPAATLTSVRPFVESTTRALRIEHAPPPEREPTVQAVGAGAHYFTTLGVRLLRGRELQPGDSAPGREAVVINERFAQVYFPNGDPIGHRISLTERRNGVAAPDYWFTIVGVSPSIRQRTMSNIAPLVYMPLDVHLGFTLGVIARADGDVRRTAEALRQEVGAVDPDVAVYNINALRRLSELSRWPARMVSFVLTLFALIASALSIGGLYGLTAYGVAQRTTEIGLRVALGARRAQVAWLLLRSTLMRVLIGLTVGLAGVFGVGQLLKAVLPETQGADTVLLALLAVALAVIVAAACFVPAGRAMRLDPVAALRHE
jgi:putative ABC transport system permease protein